MALLYDRLQSEWSYSSYVPSPSVPFSMACRFYTTDLAQTQVLLCIADSSVTNHYYIVLADMGYGGDPIQVRVCAGGGIGYARTGNGITGSGIWQTVVGRFSTPIARDAILNGDYANRASLVGFYWPAGLDKFGVASRSTSSPGWYLGGAVAEVAIWNIVVSENDVNMYHRGYSPLFIRPNSLMAYWSMHNLIPVSRVEGNYTLPWTAPNPPAKEDHPPLLMPARQAYVPISILLKQLFCDTSQNSLLKFSDLLAIPQLSCTPQGSTYTFEDLLANPQLNCSVQNTGLRFSDLLIEG